MVKLLRIACYCALLIVLCPGCGSNKLSSYYSPEDKALQETIEHLNKTPGDAALQDVLKSNYDRMLETKSQAVKDIAVQMGPGEKYKRILTELQIMQQLRETILKSPAALAVIPNPRDFTQAIQAARTKGAKDYYDMGTEYLAMNNRPYAQKAYDAFTEAYRLSSTYMDVSEKMRQAKDLATIKVVVNKVDYYNQSWNYWGFENDYLQWKMINDLNAGSYSNVKFYTAEQATSQYIRPDCIVELRYSSFNFANIRTERSTVNRSKQIQTGETKSQPPQPIYTTVYANLDITRQSLSNRGILECRIYDVASNRNILYDNFPGDYYWSNATASYRGDQRALTQEDLNLLNNRYSQPPDRNEIVRKIIDQSYYSLISRIRNGVQFSY
ncbi:MAG: hypothetical protein ABIX01_24290 [Chitinophagaceae bacterium]